MKKNKGYELKKILEFCLKCNKFFSFIPSKVLNKSKPKVLQTRNLTMIYFKDDFYHRW